MNTLSGHKDIPRRVHLMLTCLCDALYPQVGRATVDVLESLGVEVLFDERQTCCAQPAYNSGDWQNARAVARHTLDVFESAEAVVCPSASCTAMARKGWPILFENDPDENRAKEIGSRVFELTEFLWKVCGVRDWPYGLKKKQRAVFHRSCHMRELDMGRIPESLLETIPNFEIVPFDEAEQCCGFGGTFSVTFPVISRGMGEAKLACIERTDVKTIVSPDMSCLMHLKGLNDKLNKPAIETLHIAQILAEGLTK